MMRSRSGSSLRASISSSRYPTACRCSVTARRAFASSTTQSRKSSSRAARNSTVFLLAYRSMIPSSLVAVASAFFTETRASSITHLLRAVDEEAGSLAGLSFPSFPHGWRALKVFNVERPTLRNSQRVAVRYLDNAELVPPFGKDDLNRTDHAARSGHDGVTQLEVLFERRIPIFDVGPRHERREERRAAKARPL